MGSHFFHRLVDGLLSRAIPTFGQKVEYRPKTGGRYSVTAVFDSEFQQIDPQTEVVVSVNRPRVGVKLIDLPGEPVQGDEFRIHPDFYVVNEVQEDGQGGATLWLTKKNEQAT